MVFRVRGLRDVRDQHVESQQDEERPWVSNRPVTYGLTVSNNFAKTVSMSATTSRSGRITSRLTLLVALILAVGLVAGCGSKGSSTTSSSRAPTATVSAGSSAAGDTDTEDNAACPTGGNSQPFAKTRFALHAGLALGAFHRYMYKPLKNGGFSSGADKRVRTFGKAALAGAFTVHELKVAKGFAQASPTLCNAAQSVSDRFSSLTSKLKSGTATEGDLNVAQTGFTGLQNSAKQNGFGFDEQNVTVPGAG